MKVTIMSPDALREYNAEWIEVVTKEGSRTILAGHAPFLAQLSPQRTLSMKLPGGAVRSITVVGGVISVERNQVTIVLEAS
jgi:F0F1-type ATP synthase epsilon subunit